MDNKGCCGTCKWHSYEDISYGWVCVNSDSDNFTDWTEFDDCCEHYERRCELD